MVAGLLPFAGRAVDDAAAHAGLERIADEDVVNAQPAVLLVAEHPVVPPGIALLGLRKHPECIAQAEREQLPEVRPLLAGVVDGLAQAFGIVGIAVFRRHVEVAEQHQPGLGGELGGDMPVQCLEPAHLVGKLFAARGLPIDEIAVDQAQGPARGIHRGREDAGLLVLEAG